MAAGWEICIFDIGRSAYVHMHDCMHAYMYALRSMQLGKFVYIRDSTHDFHLQVCPRQTPTVCSDHASNSQSPGSAFSRGSVARAAGSERLGSGQPAASGQAAASGQKGRGTRPRGHSRICGPVSGCAVAPYPMVEWVPPPTGPVTARSSWRQSPRALAPSIHGGSHGRACNSQSTKTPAPEPKRGRSCDRRVRYSSANMSSVSLSDAVQPDLVLSTVCRFLPPRWIG